MTVEEIQIKKHKLEGKIENLLAEFCHETGLFITSMDMESMAVWDGEDDSAYTINLKIEI